MTRAAEEMRRNSSLGDEKRDAGLTTPAYIRRYDDIVYGEDRDWNVLDVYRNRYLSGKLPVIMIVHGGGWVYGSKEVYQWYGIELAKRGFAVVNYSYRLAPENKFPASLQDSLKAAGWIMEHSGEYGFDTDHIFAVGDSAGGNLLGLLCAYLYNEDYRKQFDFPVPAGIFGEESRGRGSVSRGDAGVRKGFRIRAIGMNCGAYQLFDRDGHVDRPDDREFMKDLLVREEDPETGAGAEASGEDVKDRGAGAEASGEEAKDRSTGAEAAGEDVRDGSTGRKLADIARKYVDVAARVNADFPPAYIMTCRGDFLKEQAPLLKDAYDRAGAEAELHVFGTEEKPLYHVFHCTVTEPEGQKCNDEECDFFRKHMAPGQV